MDYHCFFRRDEDAWWKKSGDGRDVFDPQLCHYVVFRRNTRGSKVDIEERELDGANLVTSLENVDTPEPHEQLRLILPPPRRPLDQDGAYRKDATLPFTKDGFHQLLEMFQFHRGYFEGSHPSQLARLRTSGKTTSIYFSTLSSIGTPNSIAKMKLFMAFDETKRATTVLLHNLMPEQLQSVQESIKDEALQLLFIHPMLVPTLVMDILFTEIVEKAQVLYEEWRQAIKKGALVEGLYMTSEFENIDIKQEASAAHRSSFKISWIQEVLEIAIDSGNKLRIWTTEFHHVKLSDEEADEFYAAEQIICNRLEYLVDRLHIQLTWIKRFQRDMQAHRQALEVGTATLGNKLSLEIARESKRDASAMKAIAVLTMFFLPGTLVASLFAMPLFNWEAPTLREVLNQRFWIYWAVAIPATILVLMTWRIWYKFQEWQKGNRTGNNFVAGFRLWLMSGREKSVDGIGDDEKGDAG